MLEPDYPREKPLKEALKSGKFCVFEAFLVVVRNRSRNKVNKA